MNVLSNIFNKRPAPTPKSTPHPAIVHHTATGLHYRSPAPTTAQWLTTPFSYPDAADTGARLAQLHSAGIGTPLETEYLLSWDEVYAVLRDPDLSDFRDALSFPADATARPRLISRGGLIDPEFIVLLDGWVDPHGKPCAPAPKLVGSVLESGGVPTLLPEAVHALLDELKQFHAVPAAQRSLAFKEHSFGRMRQFALAAGCPVSDYFVHTIVLTPERLRLSMAQHGANDGKVIEVIPGFDGAPAAWLAQFDRLPLSDRYDVPDGPSLTRVVLTPEVKSVLAEIKRMPGRRAAGARAEAFVRNPFAVLGEHAHRVISADEFERVRDDAGIRFLCFTPHVERGERGEVRRVGLLIDEAGEATGAGEATAWFSSAAAWPMARSA